MDNFTYYIPTRTVFGKGSIAQLPSLLPAGVKVGIIYGGGSIKKNGVYDQVVAALKGFSFVEFGGVEPNPVYETLMKAADLCRKEKVGFLLAVGGGSVLDGVKFIAGAAKYDGADPWDVLLGKATFKAAIPLGTVLTLPATGSECNPNSVVSRKSTHEKLYFGSELVIPKFAILDPETTFSLPTRQTVNGIVDAFVHVMEQYGTRFNDAPLQDRQAEAILSTLVEQAPIVLKNPQDYAARANIMWSATQALNMLIACGVVQDWATHMIGHELTAFYGLDHAQTLAIVMPRLLKKQMQGKKGKLEQMGKRVWGLSSGDVACQCIDRIEAFFNSIGMKTRLADYGVNAQEAAAKVRDRFAQRQTVLGENGDLTPQRVYEILEQC
jgi:NADP-dependent alcohol dehydrogenase